MYIELRCNVCGESSPVQFETLLSMWKRGYDNLCEKHRDTAQVVAEITCRCGHTSKYDKNSPMFRYVFQLIFGEFIVNA
jgi:hypothetical protein